VQTVLAMAQHQVHLAKGAIAHAALLHGRVELREIMSHLFGVHVDHAAIHDQRDHVGDVRALQGRE
jgi:hypothetical protein